VIVAGGGARESGAELRALVERLGCPLVTTAAGKGLLPHEHPANLGTSLHHAGVQELVCDADVVLAVGTELGETDLFNAPKLELRGRLIRIDIDPHKLCDQYATDLPIHADAKASLGSLLEALPTRAHPTSAHAGRVADLRAQIDGALDRQARGWQRALEAIRVALPSDAAVFTDMTQIAYFGNYAFPVDAPRRWFHPSGYGTLGYALPAAIGAKIGSPARAIAALAGDFGLQFTLGELMTAVEAGLSIPVIVWNNSALGQIRDDMVAAGIPPTDVVARNPDFVALARACGARAVRARDASQLSEAVQIALGASGPTLIEVAAGDF
jgi:thiamine pyrophosphate-dependent acetolactate synthase large subunit-like protein